MAKAVLKGGKVGVGKKLKGKKTAAQRRQPTVDSPLPRSFRQHTEAVSESIDFSLQEDMGLLGLVVPAAELSVSERGLIRVRAAQRRAEQKSDKLDMVRELLRGILFDNRDIRKLVIDEGGPAALRAFIWTRDLTRDGAADEDAKVRARDVIGYPWKVCQGCPHFVLSHLLGGRCTVGGCQCDHVGLADVDYAARIKCACGHVGGVHAMDAEAPARVSPSVDPAVVEALERGPDSPIGGGYSVTVSPHGGLVTVPAVTQVANPAQRKAQRRRGRRPVVGPTCSGVVFDTLKKIDVPCPCTVTFSDVVTA